MSALRDDRAIDDMPRDAVRDRRSAACAPPNARRRSRPPPRLRGCACGVDEPHAVRFDVHPLDARRGVELDVLAASSLPRSIDWWMSARWMTAYGLLNRARNASPTGIGRLRIPSIASIITSSSVYTARCARARRRRARPWPRTPFGPELEAGADLADLGRLLEKLDGDNRSGSTPARPPCRRCRRRRRAPVPSGQGRRSSLLAARVRRCSYTPSLRCSGDSSAMTRYSGARANDWQGARARAPARRTCRPARTRSRVSFDLSPSPLALDRMEHARRRRSGQSDLPRRDAAAARRTPSC